MLFLGRFIKVYTSLGGLGVWVFFFPKLLHGEYRSVYNVLHCANEKCVL